ncbi:MAG TPA: PhoU domain-containing protein [Candidatus Limnocylindrales bacterium]|nr:PhoU domain-containing protein [Candidatus Limnocylindrales bacterium]
MDADGRRPEVAVGRAGGPVGGPAGGGGPAATAGRRAALDLEEREIEELIVRMGLLVESQIRDALDALRTGDAEAAARVVAGDEEVNDVQRRIGILILTAIATQQPVAHDLRLLLALDRVAYELERIGDHAAAVARQARELAAGQEIGGPAGGAADGQARLGTESDGEEGLGTEPDGKARLGTDRDENVALGTDDLVRMGEIGADLLIAALRTLVDVDPERARAVAAGDDEIDHLYRRLLGAVVEAMRTDPATVERGTRILFAARDLERIGDRVTNIAEDVVFLATGTIEDLNR